MGFAVVALRELALSVRCKRIWITAHQAQECALISLEGAKRHFAGITTGKVLQEFIVERHP
jgi:hypothetical protein